jgi:hypothetical protein
VITGVPVPAIPSWLLEPLWDQFAALLPRRPVYAASHPLGCHRPRIPDRVVFEKLIQVLRFGCSYEAIADSACSATTIRARRALPRETLGCLRISMVCSGSRFPAQLADLGRFGAADPGRLSLVGLGLAEPRPQCLGADPQPT